jgi:hypothetical protein
MKKQTFAIGDITEMMCAGCDLEQPHNILAVTKLGVITKAVCETCETVSTFSKGVKTATSIKTSKNASPYDRTRKYKTGQAMTHETFGRGEVSAVIEPHKIDVIFGDRTRRLIHEQV